jgi:hypothetical protein
VRAADLLKPSCGKPSNEWSTTMTDAPPKEDDAAAARRAQRVATVGVAEHGSSAVLVTVAPGGELLDRRCIELIDRGLPTHPHHHEGSWAVGRYVNIPGARALSLADAVALARVLRAVHLSQSQAWRPAQRLHTSDPRTIARLLERSGLPRTRRPSPCVISSRRSRWSTIWMPCWPSESDVISRSGGPRLRVGLVGT